MLYVTYSSMRNMTYICNVKFKSNIHDGNNLNVLYSSFIVNKNSLIKFNKEEDCGVFIYIIVNNVDKS